MDPHVARLQQEGFPVRKVDGSRETRLAQQFGVNRYPTLVLVSGGREVRRASGFHTYQQLRQLLASGGVTAPAARSPQARAQPSRQGASPGVVPATFASPAPQGEAAYQVGSDLGPAAPAITIPVAPAHSPRQLGQPAAHTATTTGPNPNRLLSASVRIKVKDANGSSFGTGTIIDARQGEALVLTCAHLFRDGANQVSTGPVSVELFRPSGAGVQVADTVAGQVLSYDFGRDVALVSIRPRGTVEVARVAMSPTAATVGGGVWSVGCDHGADPTVRTGQVTTVDKYQSPPSLTATGAPVVGRSGGGLFDASGQVVGVCFGSDEQAGEGFYAKLSSIHSELDKLGLSEIYRSGSSAPIGGLVSTAPAASTAQAASTAPPAMTALPAIASAPAPLPDGLVPVRPRPQAANPSPIVRGQSNFPAPNALANLTPNERAALEELSQRASESEVVCVVRPKQAGGKSEVITLEAVSPQFLQALRSMPASR